MDKKEGAYIFLAILAMTLILSFRQLIKETLTIHLFLIYLLVSVIIILTYTLAKKITAKILDLKIKHKPWMLNRFLLTEWAHFKKPLAIGLILPLLLSILSNGLFKVLILLEFDIEKTPSRVVKKYGSRRYSNIMDWDYSLIIFYGMLSLIILSLISNIFNNDFANILSWYSILYAMWNLLPLISPEGNKMFFGSRPLTIFSWVLLLITLSAVIIF